MKHRRLLFLTVPLLGLLVGWAMAPGGGLRGKNGAPAFRSGGRTDKTADRPWTGEDFVKQLRARNGGADGPRAAVDPLDSLLREWTPEELRAALEECLRRPELMERTAGGEPLGDVIFKEWLRRDFSAGRDWLLQQTEVGQAALANALLLNWPVDRAEEGLAFLREHPALTRGRHEAIVNIVLTAAAKQGAAEMAALWKELNAEGFATSFDSSTSLNLGGRPVAFPPGFDFPELLEATGSTITPGNPWSNPHIILNGWLHTDREGAWKWMQENHGGAGLMLLQTQWWKGPPDTLGWFTGKMAAMDPAGRTGLLQSQLNRWSASPESAGAMLAAARNSPALHREILEYATQGLFSGTFRSNTGLLDGLGDPEERLRFLETLERKEQPQGPITKEWSGDADEQKALEATLRSWHADEARVARIVARLKGGRQ